MLSEHELQAGVSTAFSSSPKLSRVFLWLDSDTENMFSVSFRKHRDEKGKQLVNFDYQNVNSRCSRHRYVTSTARASSVFPSSYRNTILTNQRAYFLCIVFL